MTDTNQEVREPTATQIEAAAEVIWTDSSARYGGPWKDVPEEAIAAIQTRATAKAALSAALASAPPPAVPDAAGVRSVRLTWTEDDEGTTERAVTAVGEYAVKYDCWAGRYAWCPQLHGRNFSGTSFQSKDAAKAAAQADFDRRILSSIEPTPSPELRHFANCVQCGRIVDTREKSAGGDAYGCEVGADRWVCSFSCYETELGGTPSPEPQASGSKCEDCARPYGDQHGFPDLVVPHPVWEKLMPGRDGAGLLCPSCMCKRGHDLGIESGSVFTSGPFVASEAQQTAVMSPEPQASNAGAAMRVALEATGCTDEANLIDMANVGLSLMSRIDVLNFEGSPYFGWAPADDPAEIVTDLFNDLEEARAALSTPEPQARERDGEVVAYDYECRSWSTDEAGRKVWSAWRSTLARTQPPLGDHIRDVQPLVRQPAFLAERTAREAAERDNARLTNANASLINDTVQMGMARDDAERRLAEVEERAREDERDRLAALLNDGNSVWCDYAHEWLTSEEDAMLPADRAALRAKPEDQAVVGKETSRDAPPEGYVVIYGSYRSWHAYRHIRVISRWGNKADAIKACWDHASQASEPSA